MVAAHTDLPWRKRFSAVWLWAVVVYFVSGCAMAPGMTYKTTTNATTNASEGTSPSALPVTGLPSVQGVQSISQDNLIEIDNGLIASQRTAQPSGIPAEVRALFDKPRPYVLGPGDVLSIVVWGHPELNLPSLQVTSGVDTSGSNSVVTGYTVDARGNVQYAFVGMVQVAGLTEAEARELLTRRLAEYVRNPQVTLRIQAYRSKRVYLDGAVAQAGVQIINDVPMTLPEAINRAGGFSAVADRSWVAVTRGERTARVSFPDLIAKGTNPSDILLRDGDLVRVFAGSDSKVYVIGEVARNAALTLNNGKLSLNQALGDAGGISQYSGDAQQVYVVRGNGGHAPQVFHLDASRPSAMALADGFALQANDVVFVDTSSLVRWSRVVNLLLPTAQTATASRAVAP
ncbi:polysaccharide biosynthesis/export family protein [Cupriavidus pampae]|uniref:Sugar transporter n=1 Tax=Cupriavidus pampae TaxID=659251 RepID=A0ABM8WWJ9_9BURK|nr:polysaccharide biosynthesis/export family protein [Cupriavidus pampae]CAG9171909.1 hypothetical protein LMG32289_02513 [Cupriavidus pampae]